MLKLECKRLQARLDEANEDQAQHIQDARAQQQEQIRALSKLNKEQIKTLSELNSSERQVIDLQWQLVDLRRQTPDNAVATTSTTTAAESYRLRGSNLRKPLTGTDVTAYAQWEHSVLEKLNIDAKMYTTKRDCVNYAIQQTAKLIFRQISS